MASTLLFKYKNTPRCEMGFCFCRWPKIIAIIEAHLRKCVIG